MTVSRHVLRGLLVVVLTVSVLQRVECKILAPSLAQTLARTAVKIGKTTLDLFCKPIMAVGRVGTPVTVLGPKSKVALKAIRRKKRVKACLTLARLRMRRRLNKRLPRYRPIL